MASSPPPGVGAVSEPEVGKTWKNRAHSTGTGQTLAPGAAVEGPGTDEAAAAGAVRHHTADQLMQYLSAGGTLAELFGTPREHMEALYCHAYRLYRNGSYDQAMQAFSLLLERDQFERRYYSGFAACLQMSQRPADALKYHGMASMLDLTDPLPVFCSAQCLLALGRSADALTALEMVEKLAASQPQHLELASRAAALRQLLNQPVESTTVIGAGNA